MSEIKKNQFIRYVGGRKRIHEVRRETNDEILYRATLEGNPIKLRVVVQIGHPESKGSYVGWQGLSLRKEVGSVEEARAFVAELKKLTLGGN